MTKTPVPTLLTCLLWLACAPLPEPAEVPVVAADEDLSILVGEWSGEYTSVDTGRDGRIRFSLTADGDAAHGDVLMFPAVAGDGDGDGGGDDARRPDGPLGAQTLTIRFVRLRPEDETVTGTLEPYLDPDCDCMVTTTFTGRVSRDSIEGTFETRGGREYRDTSGRWRVDRRP